MTHAANSSTQTSRCDFLRTVAQQAGEQVCQIQEALERFQHVLEAIDSKEKSIRTPMGNTEFAGSCVSECHFDSAHRTTSGPSITLNNQDGFLVIVETRLTQIMQRLSVVLLDSVRRLVDVGVGKRLPLVEVVQPVKTAVDDFRLELNVLLNQCMDARLRRVELLNQLEVGSLSVDKPVFEV